MVTSAMEEVIPQNTAGVGVRDATLAGVAEKTSLERHMNKHRTRGTANLEQNLKRAFRKKQ